MSETGFISSLKDKLVSRRRFLKGMSATCAAAAVAGCSKSDSDTVYLGGGLDSTPNLQPPLITEEVYEGASPHNCGGGCLLKAYVSNGVIKRFTTDERPEKTYLDTIPGDYLQERVCPRCRGQKGWIYSSNRLTYPLIQTKERGDLTGFKRVSWTEAANYFKAKLEKIRKTYGPAAFHNVYSSGMGNGYDPTGVLQKFTGLPAGWTTYRDDYSFPEWEHTHRIMHDEESQPKSNDTQDAFNSDNLVVWCYNLSEMFNQQQITWMYRQIKEKGVKVTVIDQHQSKTALYADDFIAPVHATDTAMMLAMIYCALKEYRNELKALYTRHTPFNVTTDAELRQAVGRYIYGFFDTDPSDPADVNESYIFPPAPDANQTTFTTNFAVPAGASLSAYVLGGSETDPCNQGPSIYPDRVGYNSRSYTVDGEADPLAGKYTRGYGQVAKTPEWAANICGVSPEKIRELTRMFLTTDVTCWTMGGQQRNSEGEQVCWMYSVLMTFFLSFGKPGRTFGRPYGKGNDTRQTIGINSSTTYSTWTDAVSATSFNSDYNHLRDGNGGYTGDSYLGTIAPYLNTTGTAWKQTGTIADYLVDTTKTTIEPLSKKAYRTIPVFLWLDAVEATNQPKVQDADGTMVWPSRWNDGQVKRLPAPIKFIWHVGGNININQNGDTNLATKILTATHSSYVDTTEVPGVSGVQMNPYGYKLDFIGLCDVVMTSSARWADLVLPGTMGFERWQGANSGRSPMTYVTKKVTDPQGDAIAEIEMGAELCAAFGERDNYYNGYDKTFAHSFEEWVWRTTLDDPTNMAKFDGRDYEGWLKDGMYKDHDDLTKVKNYISYESYLNNPGRTTIPTAKPSQTMNNTKTAMWTMTGRVEAFSLTMMEDYEMRFYNNIDSAVTLENGGQLKTNNTAAGDLNKGRYIYPIPMYIPIVEGRHHDDNAEPHPDPLGLKSEYPVSFHTWHIIYRSHSTFNSSPYTNEVKYYKRDAQGNPSYLKRSITNVDAGSTIHVGKDDTAAPAVWMDEVYETVWLNPSTASENGITEGMPIICESPRGKIKVSAHLSERIRPGVVMIGQGSWYNPDNNGAGGAIDKNTVDNGGNANTLFSLRPSRIGQGMTLASDCRIKIYPA